MASKTHVTPTNRERIHALFPGVELEESLMGFSYDIMRVSPEDVPLVKAVLLLLGCEDVCNTNSAPQLLEPTWGGAVFTYNRPSLAEDASAYIHTVQLVAYLNRLDAKEKVDGLRKAGGDGA